PGAGGAGRGSPGEGGDLRGAARSAGRPAALLLRTGQRAGSCPRHHAAGFLRPVQPPDPVAVLPGLGEVPISDSVRARRKRPFFALRAGAIGSGYAGLTEPIAPARS